MMWTAQTQKEKFAALAVGLFAGIYPLFLLHGYMDVLEAKLLLLKGIIIITVGGIFLLQITDICLQENKMQYFRNKIKDSYFSMSITDRAVLGLAISFFISFVLSSDKKIGWTGIDARGSGMLYYLLMFLLYFMVSRYYIPGKQERNWWFLSTIILIIYALIQFLGFDFLKLFPDDAEGIATDYLSFLGNTGIFGLYISLVMPASMYACCVSDRKNISSRELIIYYSTYFLCCTGLLCANCDAAYIGFAVGYAGLAVITSKELKASLRFLMLTAAACLIVKLTGVLFAFFGETVRNVSWITSILLNSPFIWFIMMASLIIAGFIKACSIKCYRKICITAVTLTILILLGSFVWFSVFDRVTPLARMENYLRFSDTWGTERGYIFSRLLQAFMDGTILQKLFGWGPGMTFSVIQTYFWEEMCANFFYIYDDAHSQWITLLITTGISGCLWMIASLGFAIYRVFKKSSEPVWGVLLIVYLAVSSVSITQPVSGPYLWIGLGVAEAVVKRSKNLNFL